MTSESFAPVVERVRRPYLDEGMMDDCYDSHDFLFHPSWRALCSLDDIEPKDSTVVVHWTTQWWSILVIIIETYCIRLSGMIIPPVTPKSKQWFLYHTTSDGRGPGRDADTVFISCHGRRLWLFTSLAVQGSQVGRRGAARTGMHARVARKAFLINIPHDSVSQDVSRS